MASRPLAAALLLFGILGPQVTCSSMQCLTADGKMAPCGPGNDQCGPPLTGGPQYHIKDASCGMNDPNGVMYDERHGLYHVFYQDHLWAPMPDDVPTGREGPVWGHAVSADLVHWAHLPVGLWNGDGWYDMHGIFTGSATIVDELGGPVMTFPGLCDIYPPGSSELGPIQGCLYGYAFGVAIPDDPEDPLLTNWTHKRWIANDTFDDPSSAWQTEQGEWRMIGHCGDGTYGDCGDDTDFNAAPIWASGDFLTWRKVGFTNMPAGECASLFPLPPLVEGTSLQQQDQEVPLTHVHKWGCGWLQDCYAIGSWVDGVGDEPGNWTTSPSSPTGALYERGIYYAAKDFFDSASGRRINWAWAPLYTDSFALPREVRYDPRLQQLVFSSLPEQAALRSATLDEITAKTPLGQGVEPVTLAASAQSEAEFIFELSDESDSCVTVTLTCDGAAATSFLLEVPLMTEGGVAYHSANVTGNSAAVEDDDAGLNGASDAPATGDSFDWMWSFTDELRLLPLERVVSLRLFFDHTIAEAYFNGRVGMTLPLSGCDSGRVELEISADQGASLANASVFEVGSIWVTPEEVIEASRRK